MRFASTATPSPSVPCGSGKTIMLSAVAGNILDEPDAKACILAHRDELTAQNRAKFARVNPGLSTSVFDAKEKSWAGRATFAMVQTLSRDTHLAAMPALDLLVIDEAQHAASPVLPARDRAGARQERKDTALRRHRDTGPQRRPGAA